MTGEMHIKCVPVPEEFTARHKDDNGEAGAFTVETHLQHVTRSGKCMLVRNVMKALDFSSADLLLLMMLCTDKDGDLADHEETRLDLGALQRAGGEA